MRSEKHRGLKKLSEMFVVDRPVHVSYENMHRIFVLIKQDCARMLFEWSDVKDAPIQPDEVVDLAIQKKSKPVL